MPANVTIRLGLDATDPARNDTTVDVSNRILELLMPAFVSPPTVNTDLMPDEIVIEGTLAGDFEEIEE